MRYELAQINVGRLRAPTDSPVVAEFMNALDAINALAEASPGFVWRFQTEDGNATAVRPYDDEQVLINVSTWESLEALGDYVYRSPRAVLAGGRHHDRSRRSQRLPSLIGSGLIDV